MISFRQFMPADDPGQARPKDAKGIEMLWGVKIPLRDGVRLNATVFRPKGQEKPLPVIFTLTPYIADSYQPRAVYFAQNGYVFAMVDVRGRGNSEGHFNPMLNEARDGQVTMWGGSYGGFDQWATAKEFPEHLTTIVPVASAFMAVDFPFPHNIKSQYLMQWLTYTSGVTPNANLFGTSSFWVEKFRELYGNHRPFKELDQIVGNLSTHFQDMVAHPTQDDYYAPVEPSDADFAKFNLPILTITGSYDGDQPGAMTYYRKHMALGTPEAVANHYLVIGPWDHAGTRTPAKEVGGLTFGDASMVDVNKLHKDWYDWTMKGGSKPEFLKKRVAYYLMGADEWKYADSLDTISNETRKLYLGSQGQAGDVFHSGSLTEKPIEGAAADSYVYDPLDTRPGELEAAEEVRDYLTDQRAVLNLFGSGLVYHSEPFSKATEITGYVKLNAWIELDVPDTDFHATLYEILKDGRSILLTEDAQRARYRESLREAKLVTPGEVACYEFNSFMYFSRQIAEGSRLRLVFGAINSIQAEKNYNSGGAVELETAKDARVAHVKLFHDAEHPSVLELPIVK